MEIPKYIKKSNFYLSLEENLDEENDEDYDVFKNIPEKFKNFDPSLKTEKDLLKLILMLSFWGIEEIPYTFLDFMRSFIDNIEVKKYLETELNENDYFLILKSYIFKNLDELINYSIILPNKYIHDYTFYLIEKENIYTPFLFEEIPVKTIAIKSNKAPSSNKTPEERLQQIKKYGFNLNNSIIIEFNDIKNLIPKIIFNDVFTKNVKVINIKDFKSVKYHIKIKTLLFYFNDEE